MKILFIGGTGNISSAISSLLLEQGHELYLLNRGIHKVMLPIGAIELYGDIYNEAEVEKLLDDKIFDVAVDFIAYLEEDVERDWRLFRNRVKQYIFISSASAYQKPVRNYLITESTPLVNPYWQYSRDKAACEAALMEYHANDNFPVTIVRPSHTYGNSFIPLALHGKKGDWQTLKRIREEKPVLIPGDGTSLWTVTHNSDFAKGFIGLMANPHAIGQAIHITSDEALTWTQIYETIADKLGVTLNPVYVPSQLLANAGQSFGYDYRGGLFGDKMHSVLFDNTKLKRLVPDYVATTRFDQGIGHTVAHFLIHPELQVEDPDFDIFCDKIAQAMTLSYRTLCDESK